MNRSGRTLVILLSMHRSGSSFTASVLHEMGMSLGPFELLGAEPHNIHGHFEAMPILELSREVQTRVYGFPDELPETPETMSRLIDSRGEWAETIEVPQQHIDRGRSLLGTLIDSGEVSGFKDPRTVLLWPFWRRVLGAFPEVRVAPIALLRSPHEIAMSLFTRRQGTLGYRTSLDLVAVHFLRLRAILETWPHAIPRLCFGSDRYLDDLAHAVHSSGLSWDPSRVGRLYDGSCVHHAPAVVVHEAQDVFDTLMEVKARVSDGSANQVRLHADAVEREDLLQRQFDRSRNDTAYLNEQLRLVSCQKLESERLLREAREQLGRTEETLRATRLDLERTEQSLHRSERELSEARAAHLRTEDRLAQALASCSELRARLDRFESHRAIGLALRARRLLRRGLQSFKTRAVAWNLHRP